MNVPPLPEDPSPYLVGITGKDSYLSVLDLKLGPESTVSLILQRLVQKAMANVDRVQVANKGILESRELQGVFLNFIKKEVDGLLLMKEVYLHPSLRSWLLSKQGFQNPRAWKKVGIFIGLAPDKLETDKIPSQLTTTIASAQQIHKLLCSALLQNQSSKTALPR